MLKNLSFCFCVALPVSAFAHLTWIDAKEDHLTLSTGHNFPSREITVTGQYVESITCTTLENLPRTLAFKPDSSRYVFDFKPDNCLAILNTTQIELTPKQGAAHLAENKADKTLVNKARQGLQFKETYFKSAQLQPIELNSALYNTKIAQFVFMPGNPETIYIYKDGKPLAGLSVGLEYPQTPITLWSKTGPDGKVTLLLKPKTDALLRALLAEENGEEFKSQFLSVLIQQ